MAECRGKTKAAAKQTRLLSEAMDFRENDNPQVPGGWSAARAGVDDHSSVDSFLGQQLNPNHDHTATDKDR